MGLAFGEPQPQPQQLSMAAGASSVERDGDERPDDQPSPASRPLRKRAAAAVTVADEGAWARVLRQAAGEEQEEQDAAARAPSEAAPESAARVKRVRARVRKQPPSGEPSAAASGSALLAPARRAHVLQALAQTRCGEGREGVYFADSAFDWRALAVTAGEQTWSLLGDASAGVGQLAGEGGDGGDGGGPAPAPAAQLAPPAPPAAPQRCAAPDLAALGASFFAQPDHARAAWEANREALRDDFKRKRRAVKGRK